jgi:hypothetical protein
LKPQNTHLQYDARHDAVMLVDHTRRQGTESVHLAWDLTPEFLYCVGAWGLRGAGRRKLNAVERVLRWFGFHVAKAKATRTIEGRDGSIRVTVEHLT